MNYTVTVASQILNVTENALYKTLELSRWITEDFSPLKEDFVQLVVTHKTKENTITELIITEKGLKQLKQML